MSEDHANHEDRPFHYEAGKAVFDGPAEREKREQATHAKREDEFKEQQIVIARDQLSLQRQTFWTQVVVIIFGILGLGFTAYQAHTSKISADAAQQAAAIAQQALNESKLSSKAQSEFAERSLKLSAGQSTQAIEASARQAKQAITASANQTTRVLSSSSVNQREDQRPYITAQGSTFGPLQAGFLYANFDLINYGRTPAVGVTHTGYVFFGKDAIPQAYKFFDDLDAKEKAGTLRHDKGVVIFPYVSNLKPDFTTFQSLSQVTADLIPEVSKDAGVAIAGRIYYSDRFGAKYETDVCLFRAANTSVPLCPHHNELR